ncbi:hypothetical protein TEA_007401 [Camellia sinensis var. sinensis]|uniref:Cytochrome P450 n=1 Tax=Camellia sinensis var. sinensis TaxID=542762 RepID=A0A4S4EBR5_CAMSN|nr:hypothetical protein TEA_007401 [Camellia sinensis var. sinensis]
MEFVNYLSLLVLLIPIFLFLTKKTSNKLPPGSMGLPIVGHSLSLLHAMRANKGEAWFHERIRKYGPISKLSLFGTPTVFLHGQAANKFIYTCDSKTVSNQQPASMRRVCGEKIILELSGEDHKRIRGALVSFLKHEALKQYVGKMDEEVRKHMEMHWHGKNEVNVMPLMKTLTFNIICSLIFGIERGARRHALRGLFQNMIEGMLIRNEDNSALLSDEEIEDNAVIIMVGEYDTSSILLTFLIRLLANEPSIYAAIVQEEIAKSKTLGELLPWNDLTKMKYTWRVAMETLKYNPSWVLFLQEGPQRYRIWRISSTKRVATSMTHMDETIFPNPTRFEKQAPAPPYCFVAFGGGPRMRPGYEFARIETLAIIHYLVTQFTCKLSCIDDSFCRDPMPVFNQGLPIHIKPKKSNGAI